MVRSRAYTFLIGNFIYSVVLWSAVDMRRSACWQVLRWARVTFLFRTPTVRVTRSSTSVLTARFRYPAFFSPEIAGCTCGMAGPFIVGLYALLLV
ncbi:hypothetical protein FB451DRAFT_368923 [Mycena latifolia]|nr:hypothetical protein FB451DRAFT_368923 [Mycena latifolia]